MNKYTNNKNGKTYISIREDIINATNKDDGQIMVLYYPEEKPDMHFVRDLEEFRVKFTPVK